MSEFQIGLLIIAVVVVLAVYVYGWWQQWRYRRNIEHIENASEALARNNVTKSTTAQPSIKRGHSTAEAAPLTATLLDEQVDYIVSITPKFPLSAQALARVWERRFDFGKTLRAIGRNAATGAWERLIPESLATYSELKVGLQLVDRNGAVSAVRLAEFRELMDEIGRKENANMILPVVDDALARARALDAFCAEVDQMVGLNLACNPDQPLFANTVAAAVQALGMSLQADGTFHLFGEDGSTLFTLGTFDGTPFQHHTLDQMRVERLTLLLDIPRVSEPARCFDEMSRLAMDLADTLHAALVDDQGVVLDKAALERIRTRIVAVEQRMLQGGIAPGSALALRLFS